MKVKELIMQLSNLDQELEVIMSKDGEGNDFSPLYGLDTDHIYKAESTYSGGVINMKHSAEDNCISESEQERLITVPRCVLLWPIN